MLAGKLCATCCKAITHWCPPPPARHPPREPVDLRALADMVSGAVEGGIILSKAMREPKLLSEQILLVRTFVRLLFDAAA